MCETTLETTLETTCETADATTAATPSYENRSHRRQSALALAANREASHQPAGVGVVVAGAGAPVVAAGVAAGV
jgi:hypothetical protein